MGEKKKEDKESKAQKGEENQQENLASTQKKVNTNWYMGEKDIHFDDSICS